MTEALWKETPVVASNVGGISLQITDGESGFLCEPTDNHGFAEKIIELLRNPDMGKEMAIRGKEAVRKKFLITRLVLDYLDLLNDVMG